MPPPSLRPSLPTYLQPPKSHRKLPPIPAVLEELPGPLAEPMAREERRRLVRDLIKKARLERCSLDSITPLKVMTVHTLCKVDATSFTTLLRHSCTTVRNSSIHCSNYMTLSMCMVILYMYMYYAHVVSQ